MFELEDLVGQRENLVDQLRGHLVVGGSARVQLPQLTPSAGRACLEVDGLGVGSNGHLVLGGRFHPHMMTQTPDNIEG